MKGFAKWLVKRRILVILLCVVLMVPAVLGMAATKTKYAVHPTLITCHGVLNNAYSNDIQAVITLDDLF